ncbi:hypothetical protein [Synechococcus sp. MIT S1220]|uniref:hypothetical protein n=1 Tax=Synechococcus sp. MIT S1220 TaxID=3082549 RepID=UPI0039B0CC06
MAKKFLDHLKSSGNHHYAYGVNLKSPRVKFDENSRKRFEIVADLEGSGNHTWNHLSNDRGEVSSKNLVKGFKSHAAANQGSDRKLIGAMPAGDVHNSNSFLFEYRSIKAKEKQGKLIWQAKVLDHDYVHDNYQFLRAAFGQRTLHNHLRFNPNKHFVSGFDSYSVSRQVSGPLSRRILDDDFYDEIGGDRGPLKFSFGHIWHGITHGASTVAHAAEHVADKVSSGVTSVVSKAGSAISKAATTVVDDTKKAVSQAVKFADDEVIMPVVNATEKLAKSLFGYNHFDYTLSFPSLSIDESEGAFSASLNVDPTMNGSLNLKAGIVGALVPETVQLNFQPALEISGSVEVDLSGADVDKTFTLDGPSVNAPAIDPPIIDAAQIDSEIDFEFEGDASVFDDGSTLGATVTFTPSALFQIGLDDTGVSNTSTTPTITTQVPGGFEPKAGLSLTATPKLTFKAGASVPSEVPVIGGTSIASIDTVLSNPLTLSIDSSDFTSINVSVSGDLDCDLSLLGESVPIASTNLYGPVQTSITI